MISSFGIVLLFFNRLSHLSLAYSAASVDEVIQFFAGLSLSYIIFFVILFIIIRMIILWYFKINKRVDSLEEIRDTNKEIRDLMKVQVNQNIQNNLQGKEY